MGELTPEKIIDDALISAAKMISAACISASAHEIHISEIRIVYCNLSMVITPAGGQHPEIGITKLLRVESSVSGDQG